MKIKFVCSPNKGLALNFFLEITTLNHAAHAYQISRIQEVAVTQDDAQGASIFYYLYLIYIVEYKLLIKLKSLALKQFYKSYTFFVSKKNFVLSKL